MKGPEGYDARTGKRFDISRCSVCAGVGERTITEQGVKQIVLCTNCYGTGTGVRPLTPDEEFLLDEMINGPIGGNEPIPTRGKSFVQSMMDEVAENVIDPKKAKE